jgi:hypothetical protein
MEAVFSILIKNEDDSFRHHGSGFLIGSDGLFISAAHVFFGFSNPYETLYCAFPSDSSKIIKILSVKLQYRFKEKQKGSVYLDLAIGKIDYKTDKFLILKRKRPVLGTIHTITGYVFAGKDNNRFHLKPDGYIDILTTTVVNRFAVISLDPNDYEKQDSLIQNTKKYNNCITLKRTVHHGSSGCPVINSNGQVIGMFFGFPNNRMICHILTSKYIGKQIKKMTGYKYDRYQDIKK